jgi:bacteriocin-like protein
MSDQEKKQQSISPQPNAENKKESGELSEEELKKVSGGVTNFQSQSATADATHTGWIEQYSFNNGASNP